MFRPLTLLVACLALPTTVAGAQKVADNEGANKPLGQFLTVRSPIDDTVIGRVRNTAQDLLIRSEKESRQAVLILEVTSGDSPYYQVQGLAELLSSARLAAVRTVAWVPASVTGSHAVVALACNEIVMHPDAELGDISRGTALEEVQMQFVRSLVEKRRNAKVNWPLARGLLDRKAEVIRATVTSEDKQVSSRVVGRSELKLIQESNPGATQI